MPRKISCMIIDDDETSRFILANLANKNDHLELVKACSDTSESREVLEKKEVDLLLLDIEMPYENGVDMLEKLEKRPNVIFITSHTRHAIKAFEYDAIDYIVKPVNLERLNNAVEKAKRRIFGIVQEPIFDDKEEFMMVKKNRETKKFPYRSVDYIEGSSSYVTYNTSDGKITTTGILKQVEETLNPKVFIRIHRSFIVNINKIDKISSQEVIIRSTELPLSRKYRKEVIEMFKNQTSKIDEYSTDR